MFDPDAIIARLDEQAAKVLLANALKLQARHKRNLSRANPRPHSNPAKRGEYPKARTFNLRDAVVVEPQSLAVIRETGTVRVGVLVNAYYGGILKAQGWKGLIDSHQELLAAGAYR